MPETNFVPNPAGTWTPPPVYYGHTTAAGDGDPNGLAIGWPGDKYLDRVTGDRYTKETGDGTTSGWTSDGSGAGGGVLRGTVDPTDDPGVGASSAFYYRTDTGGVWAWNGTAWDALIS